jgi:hypothetical protein
MMKYILLVSLLFVLLLVASILPTGAPIKKNITWGEGTPYKVHPTYIKFRSGYTIPTGDPDETTIDLEGLSRSTWGGRTFGVIQFSNRWDKMDATEFFNENDVRREGGAGPLAAYINFPSDKIDLLIKLKGVKYLGPIPREGKVLQEYYVIREGKIVKEPYYKNVIINSSLQWFEVSIFSGLDGKLVLEEIDNIAKEHSYEEGDWYFYVIMRGVDLNELLDLPFVKMVYPKSIAVLYES